MKREALPLSSGAVPVPVFDGLSSLFYQVKEVVYILGLIILGGKAYHMTY